MGQAPVTQTITRTARRRFLSALSSLAMLAGLAMARLPPLLAGFCTPSAQARKTGCLSLGPTG